MSYNDRMGHEIRLKSEQKQKLSRPLQPVLLIHQNTLIFVKHDVKVLLQNLNSWRSNLSHVLLHPDKRQECIWREQQILH